MAVLSICMVSLNCWTVLQDCLKSLKASDPPVDYEIIVVDNASTDGTPDLIVKHYPTIRLIPNDRNVGFTKATNQGIAASNGKYLLWLNTDTILRPDALFQLVQFLDQHPKVGIVGPKVLNLDGSFQPQCRRGLPTPTASLFYLTKLDRMWPENQQLGQYLLTYLPIDVANEVDAVSGCCLMARREVWDTIGPLDERIFGFGEDIDWCVRAKKAGWEVWYYPASVITHLKGQGGAHSKPYHKAFGIHQAMWVFYRKHFDASYPWLVGRLVEAGILVSLTAEFISIGLRRVMLRFRILFDK